MALKFDIVGDNGNFLRSLDEAVNGVRRAQKDIEQSGMGIEDMFKRIAAAAGIAFSIDGAKSFMSQVVEMRSYFQDIESSMEVFLGSAEKGQKFMEELKAAAYYNMFEFTDLANASKQLIAYKNDIDTVIPTIQKLSDVAVGTSAPLLELVNLYNKAKSTGKVSTQDMYSWAVKGVVIKDVLKEMGEEATDTTVSFEQLNKVLDHITSEGGMFYQLQDKMMSNISAEIGQFQDNLALMLNEIGEKYQDEITGVIKIGSELIDNYQTIAGWIKDIVIAYGTYRAALAVCLTIDKAVVYWKGLEAEATMMNTLANTGETGSVTALTIAKLRLTSATKALTTAILANPYVLIAAGVATLTYAIYKLATAETDLEKAQEKVDESFENTLAEIKSEQTEIDRLFGKLRKAKEGTEEYKKTKDQIISQYDQYLQGLGNEISTLKDVEGAYKAVTKAAREASIAKGKEAALKNVQDTYGRTYAESIYTMQQFLKNREGGADLLRKIQEDLRKTGQISQEAQSKLIEYTGQQAYNGTFLPGLVKTLNDNEKYLNDYTKLVEQRFLLDEEEEKHEEKKQVRNKKVIEEEKKSLQSQLDNLSKEEALGQKGAELKKKIADLDKELKAYNTSDKSGSSAANDAANRRQKEFELDLKQIEELAAQAQTTRNAIEQARIAAIKDSSERERQEREFQHKKNLKDIAEKQESLFKEIYQDRRAAYENEQKKAGQSGKYGLDALGGLGIEGVRNQVTDKKIRNLLDNLDKVTISQLADIQKHIDDLQLPDFNTMELEKYKLILSEIFSKAAKENIENLTAELEEQRKQLEDMNSYYSEYGSPAVRRDAIMSSYAARIEEATEKGDIWGVKRLKKELEKELTDLDLSILEQKIDWVGVFGGVSTYFRTELYKSVKDLEKYMQGQKFAALDPTNKERVVSTYRNLKEQAGLSPEQAGIAKISSFADKLQAAEAKYFKARKKTIAAEERYNLAMTTYEGAVKNGGEAIIEGTKKVLDETKNQVEIAAEAEQGALNDVQVTAENFKKALDAASDGLNTIKSGIQGILGDSLQVRFDGTIQLIDGMGKAVGGELKKVADAIANVPGLNLVSAILGIVDVLKDGFAEFFASLLTLATDALNGIYSDLIDGDIIKKSASALYNSYANLLSTMTFGMSDKVLSKGWSMMGKNGEDIAHQMEILSNRNESLEQAINDLKDCINGSYGASLIDVYERMIDAQKEINDNTLAQAKLQASYSGSHHSFNRYWRGYNEEQIQRLSSQIGRQWNGDLWDLSPEEMKMLRSNVDMWNQIINTGKGPYGVSVAEKLNEYIEQAGKLEEITNTLYENLTTTTKENVFDDFLDSLYELGDGSEDIFDNISKNWQEMVNKMVINNLVGARFQKELESWYEELAKLNEARTNGELTDAEYKQRLDALKAQYDGYVKDAQRDIDTLRSEGIIQATNAEKYSQEASKGGWGAMSEDTAGELNGRFTAMQIAGERISEGVSAMLGTLSALSSLTEGSNMTLAEIRNLMIMNNAFLEDILAANKEYYKKFHAQLDKIVTQTK